MKSLIARAFRALALVIATLALALGPSGNLLAQQSSNTQQPANNQQQSGQGDQAPPEAGGPGGDTGAIALPKKKEEPPPPRPTTPKKIEGMPDYSLHVDVPLVQVPVTVISKDGHFIPGLKKENFKVFEDGVQQQISGFNQTEAPITAVLLVEFAATNYNFIYDALNASYTFASQLRPQDWVAVVDFDMKPQILVDFTQDKRAIYGALNSMRVPGFSETCVYDALYDTLDRLQRIDGRKYVVLIASGYDSFSKHTLDQIYKKVQGTPDVTIFTISTGQAARLMSEPYMSGPTQLSYLQADNQMRTWARMTGGEAFFPRFAAELPSVFGEINGTIRNEYVLAYHPSNSKQDGSYRKIKVELQAPNGGPLTINVNGKKAKVDIIAREGYKAKQEVE